MVDALHLAVRFVHLLGAVALLGGAVAVWAALRADGKTLAPATRYEWLFWGALGAMLATGVGNVGALGAPGPTTRWGRLLTAKLAVVLVVAAGSFPRTLLVCRLRDRTGDAAALAPWYAATAWALGLLVALAEVLAHG
jgi:hypothetical protein